MAKNIEDILKEIVKVTKQVHTLDNKLSKDNDLIIKHIKNLDKKLTLVLSKIEQLEIIIDAAELLEEQMDNEADLYNTEWNPYEEEYEPEEYEDYTNDPEEDQ